jgi:hypothetical protein
VVIWFAMRTSNRERRKCELRDAQFKERWVLMVAGNLGRSAVPSSALDALVCWRRWAAMQRENFELMKSGEGDG